MYHPTAKAEAQDLLALHEGPARLAACLGVVSAQLQVMQLRAQTLLGLATLVITVTGFSGPKMAASNPFSRYSMALGLLVTLSSVVMLLRNLRVRWITQFSDVDALDRLVDIIEYRNALTGRFLRQIAVLGAGLACYVASVIGYLLIGDPILR